MSDCICEACGTRMVSAGPLGDFCPNLSCKFKPDIVIKYDLTGKDSRIADLEEQIAKAQVEIERMRPVVEAARQYWVIVSSDSASFADRNIAMDELQRILRNQEYESGKPK